MTDPFNTTATRRCIKPYNVAVAPVVQDWETSYQRAYFEQAGAVMKPEVRRPLRNQDGSQIVSVLSQSKTTMKDQEPVSRSAYRNPVKLAASQQQQQSSSNGQQKSQPVIKFEKIQQPKQQAKQYPIPIENTRIKF